MCLCVWHGFYDLLYGTGTGSLIRGAILNLSCCSYQKYTLCLTISIMVECLRLQTNQSYYFHHASLFGLANPYSIVYCLFSNNLF